MNTLSAKNVLLRVPTPRSTADRLVQLFLLAGIGTAALSVMTAFGRVPW